MTAQYVATIIAIFVFTSSLVFAFVINFALTCTPFCAQVGVCITNAINFYAHVINIVVTVIEIVVDAIEIHATTRKIVITVIDIFVIEF